MAFCTNCGAKVDDGTVFCPSCGTKLTEDAPVTETPAQQSYSAPEGNYSAPGGNYASTAPAPKAKKPLNKTTLIIIGAAALAVILAVVLIIVFAGKGGRSDAVTDPNLGVYNAVTAEMYGIEVSVEDVFEGGFTIELKDKGKCALNVSGKNANGKWSLEDGVFKVSGGGVNCEGTLNSGVMVLEDVMGAGVTLTFAKEGGYSETDASLTDAQRQWNGTYYGCLVMNEANGGYAALDGQYFDMYMTVELDASGKGVFAVYFDGGGKAFAAGTCESSGIGLMALSGSVAGSAAMNTGSWTFVSVPGYTGQYTVTDDIEDGTGTYEFSLFMKKWGESWQAEIDSGFAALPPSVEWYEASIAAGEAAPFEGSTAQSGAEGSVSGGNTGAAGFTGDTAVYSYMDAGKLTLTYPTDTFFVDEDAILDTIAALDGSVKIMIVPQISSEDHDATMTYYDSYSEYDE